MEKKVFGKLVPHPPRKPPDSKPPCDDHGYKHPSRFVNHQIGRSEIISTIEIQVRTDADPTF